MTGRSRHFSANGSQYCRTPIPAKDRQAGYRYELSVLQAEFSLTQIWDRPRSGRGLFRGSHPGEHRFGPTRNRCS